MSGVVIGLCKEEVQVLLLVLGLVEVQREYVQELGTDDYETLLSIIEQLEEQV